MLNSRLRDVSYNPSEKQWWITGFNPYSQGYKPGDLTATFNVTFNNKTMYNDFKSSLDPDETRWSFNSTNYMATFTF